MNRDTSTRKNDNWQLHDDLVAVLRREHYSPDEMMAALTTCMAKVVVAADLNTEIVIEQTKKLLETSVDFQNQMRDADPETWQQRSPMAASG